MAIEIIVYVDDVKNISAADSERYIGEFEIDAQIHPEVDFETHSGFVPLKIAMSAPEFLRDRTFLSGFEFYVEAYDYEQELSVVKSHADKPGGILAWFKEKFAPNNHEIYIASPELDAAMKKCSHAITLRISPGDSLEIPLAFIFALYLAEHCNGVIWYADSDAYYDVNSRDEWVGGLKEFLDELSPEGFVGYAFEGWRPENTECPDNYPAPTTPSADIESTPHN